MQQLVWCQCIDIRVTTEGCFHIEGVERAMTAGFRLIVITLFSIQFGYNGAPIVINLDFYHFVYKLVFNFHCLVLSAEGS